MAQITKPFHDPDKIIKEPHNTDNIEAIPRDLQEFVLEDRLLR